MIYLYMMCGYKILFFVNDKNKQTKKLHLFVDLIFDCSVGSVAWLDHMESENSLYSVQVNIKA